MLKTLVIILILFSVTNTLNAQTDCPCCDETHQQFDFWIGDWIILNSLGNMAGENKVSKIEDGCIITEHWTGMKEEQAAVIIIMINQIRHGISYG